MMIDLRRKKKGGGRRRKKERKKKKKKKERKKERIVLLLIIIYRQTNYVINTNFAPYGTNHRRSVGIEISLLLQNNIYYYWL